MWIDEMSVNKYKDGDERILSLTAKTADGRVMTLDFDTDEAKGLAAWILYHLKMLNEAPIEELDDLPDRDDYRIIGRLRSYSSIPGQVQK